MSAKDVTLAILPKVGASLSLLGSLWIMLEIAGSPTKRTVVYQRLMFMFSFFDIIVSSASFASTWPIPLEEDGKPWKARGNDATCAVQGFALQLGSTLFCYNAFLSVFYVLVINYSIQEKKLKKYEWCLHIFPITFGLTTATIPAALNWYHNANLWCWIATDPDCDGDNDSEYCERFDNVHIFRWVFFFAPLWVCFLIELFCLFAVFRAVRRQEHNSRRYIQQATRRNLNDVINEARETENDESGDQPESSARPRRRSIKNDLPRTRQVASQAALYILAFYNTYIFATINRILQQSFGSSPFTILMLHSLSLPMQGFWNFLIYRRPFYLNLRRSDLTPRWEAMKASVVLSWFKSPSQKYLTGVSGVGRTSSDEPSRLSSLRLMKRRSSVPSNEDLVGEEEESKVEIEEDRNVKVSFADDSAVDESSRGRAENVLADESSQGRSKSAFDDKSRGEKALPEVQPESQPELADSSVGLFS